MFNFLRILHAALILRRAHQGPPIDERTPEQKRNDTLDVLFGVVAAFVIADWFGMYEPHASFGGGPASIGNRLMYFFGWILEFLLILVSAIVLARLTLKRISGLNTRYLIYGSFAVVSFFIHSHLAGNRAEAAMRTEAARLESQASKATQEERYRASLAEALAREAARDQHALQERALLLERYSALSAPARVRWRDDIEAAGAYGDPGVIPPMLTVEEISPGRLLIRNVASDLVCVRIAQVLRGPSPAAWERCDSDLDQKCRDIGPHGSAQFALQRDDPSPACARGQLEFRVGTPLRPEPSWWSRSALDEFDDHRLTFGDRAEDNSTDQLRDEVAMLDSMSSDHQRAARRQRELRQYDSRVEAE